jgi:hypothetical protein
MGRFGQAAVLVVALPLSVAACSTRGRDEAAAVMRALDVVRDAPADQKQAPAEALARVPCSLPIVCEARDRCAGVYRHLADAERRMHAIKERLSQDPPKSAEAIAELTDQLARAEIELDGFEQELRGCERAASLMRRTYGI